MRGDWAEVELGEVCEIISGKNQKQVENPNGKYPIYGSGGIFGYADEYLCESGTTVIGRKGTINSPIYINQKFWNVDTAFGISPATKIKSKYVYYFSLGFNFKKLDKSTTIPSLAKRDLLKIRFLLAPLPEQRAIVAKIEQLFSELDNGIANLKAAKDKLAIFRQAVLKKAFERKFKEVQLEQISNATGGYAFKSKTFSKESGQFQVIRIGNIRPGILRQDESPVFADNVEQKVIDKYLLQKNDIVITLTGTRNKRDYGHTTLINKKNLLLNQRLACLRFNTECLPRFFLYYSWTEGFKQQFFSSETGNVGQGNVGMKSIRKTTIPLPSINEQTQIVQEIETRLSVCDNAIANIEESLTKAEALRQSILKKAFAGKLLTNTELQACRQEPDWEPAAKLLERIKHDKKSTPVKKNKR
jgi:type I restriction enzyme S subunit